MFGRRGTAGHEPIHSLKERCRGAKKFDTDEIVLFRVVRVGGAQMPNARVGHRRFAVEDQAHRLNRFHGKRLMGFDQRAVVRQVVHAHRVTGVERSPERAEHFESHTAPTIARRRAHRTTLMAINCASRSPAGDGALYGVFAGKKSSGRKPPGRKSRRYADYVLVAADQVVRPAGFEPATSSVGDWRSIHLSYGRGPLILP
jgi:hypothetical protein